MLSLSIRRVGLTFLPILIVAAVLVAVAGASVQAEPPPVTPPTQPPPDPNAPGAPLAPAPGRPPATSAPAIPRCTVNGRARGEVLRGTARSDVICGRGGNDKLHARGGDVLVGGSGNDTIFARNGEPDYVVGGRGRDRAFIDDGGLDEVVGVERRGATRSVAHNPTQNRFPIHNQGWSRHAWVGRLYFTGGTGFCTGSLVAPNIVLTAAHCLYEGRSGVCFTGACGQWNADYPNGGVTFRLDQWGAQHRGEFRSRNATVAMPWFNAINNAESSRGVEANSYRGAYDFGFVVLDANASGRDAGDAAGGWFTIAPQYQGVWFWTVGYSGDGWFAQWGGNFPYFVVSKLAESSRSTGPSGDIAYEVGIGSILTGGGSGGPWIVDANNDGRWAEVAGVNSHGPGSFIGQNMWSPWLTQYAVSLLNYARTL